jgi:solute carrier family 25 phosphate transporter 3
VHVVAVAMLMFSTFEHSVDFLYGNVIRRPKNECSKGTQLGVTCVAGYMSGVTGTIISNPADNMITAINNRKGVSYVQVRFHPCIAVSGGV